MESESLICQITMYILLFCWFTDFPEMLRILPNGNHFDIYPTTSVITRGISYILSPFNGTSTTGTLNDGGILQVERNSEYNLLFVCLGENTTFVIGMFVLYLV